MNEAEQRLVAYLEANGYAWKHEPDYQAELDLPAPLATTPDFLIARGDTRLVAEVRQFETTRIRDRLEKAGGTASLSPQEVYGALRSGILEKAEQLRPLAGTGVPLIVVVANPLNADVMLDAHHVQAAMWGNPGFVIPIDTSTGGPAVGREPYFRLEDYGVFASPVIKDGTIESWENRQPHISAVAVVHERLYSDDWREEIMHRHPAADNSFDAAADAALKAIAEINEAVAAGKEPEGAYQWLSVYEVNGEDAVPVPREWFDGPRDERYSFAEGGYGRITPIRDKNNANSDLPAV